MIVYVAFPFFLFAKFLTIYFNRTESLLGPSSSPESYARTLRARDSESKVLLSPRSRQARRVVKSERQSVLSSPVYTQGIGEAQQSLLVGLSFLLLLLLLTATNIRRFRLAL